MLLDLPDVRNGATKKGKIEADTNTQTHRKRMKRVRKIEEREEVLSVR